MHVALGVGIMPQKEIISLPNPVFISSQVFCYLLTAFILQVIKTFVVIEPEQMDR
jgi:hypothetical protein